MNAKLFFKKNGSTILTCAGGIGVVATAVMAAKATPKAIKLVEEAKKEKGEELTKWETVKAAGPSYIPAILTGAATVGCIFGANVLNKHQQAALVSAYALLDQTHKDYKKKVAELYGNEADGKVREELAKDQYKDADVPEEDEDDGKQLFYDEYSRRYYRATNETVLRAEYEINKMLAESGGASLNDYYDLLNIPRMDYGEYIGWSAAQMYEMYWDSWLDFWHEKVEMEDGMECWMIHFTEPFAGFEDY